jgi:hypothetical protein
MEFSPRAGEKYGRYFSTKVYSVFIERASSKIGVDHRVGHVRRLRFLAHVSHASCWQCDGAWSERESTGGAEAISRPLFRGVLSIDVKFCNTQWEDITLFPYAFGL